ncbi:MAG: hypothetical protein ACYTBJ_15675 [Planctomycetota bacterium]|jgi:hypothetical protein
MGQNECSKQTSMNGANSRGSLDVADNANEPCRECSIAAEPGRDILTDPIRYIDSPAKTGIYGFSVCVRL